MDVGFALRLIAIALAASAVGGMLGMASGIFIVPILTEFLHVDIHTAIGASIVSVIACSSAGAAPLLRRGLINMRLVVVLEVATTLGALTGVLLAGVIPASYLFFLFAAILILSTRQMLAAREERTSDTVSGHSRVPFAMLLMYGAGVISALLGIGSGVLKVPAMDGALRLPIKVSSATSIVMIGVTAAASGGAYFMRGAIVPSIAGPVALGSVWGSILGTRLLMTTSNDRIRVLFVIVLLALATQMLLSAFGIHALSVPE